MKPPVILFFCVGDTPSAAEATAAQAIVGATVRFRNADLVPTPERAKDASGKDIISGLGGREAADGVAGTVPELYADYPNAETALATYKTKLEAELAGKFKEDLGSLKKPAGNAAAGATATPHSSHQTHEQRSARPDFAARPPGPVLPLNDPFAPGTKTVT